MDRARRDEERTVDRALDEAYRPRRRGTHGHDRPAARREAVLREPGPREPRWPVPDGCELPHGYSGFSVIQARDGMNHRHACHSKRSFARDYWKN